MAVQSINDSSSKFSRILTLGIAGAGVGAAVGALARPSVNSIVAAAKDTYVKEASADIKFLAQVLKDTKKDGFKALSKETKQALKDKGYSVNLKSIRQGIINLTEEKNLIDGGKTFKKALKRLEKNTTAKKELVDLAKETLEFKIANAKNVAITFQDGIINSMKSTASDDVKSTVKALTAKAVKSNIRKGAWLGAGIALGLGLISLIKPKQPKQEYILIREK